MASLLPSCHCLLSILQSFLSLSFDISLLAVFPMGDPPGFLGHQRSEVETTSALTAGIELSEEDRVMDRELKGIVKGIWSNP